MASMFDGTPLLEDLKSALVNDPELRERFNEASTHPMECECELCKEYWQLMGDDE